MLGCGCPDGFTLIDFESVPNADPNTDRNAVPANYSGFVWTNFNVVAPSLIYPNSGYMALLNSGSEHFVARNTPNLMTSIGSVPSQLFGVKSFLATGAWNNNLQLSLLGYRSGFVIYTQKVILQATTASIINLDWTNIDRINFTSSGGTSAGYPHYAGLHFAMDDLCLTKKLPEIIIGK